MGDRALVHAFVTDHPALARSLHAELEKGRKEVLDRIRYAADWADFKRRVGHLEGLDAAMQACIDVEKKLRGND